MIQGIISKIASDATCLSLIGTYNGAAKVFPVTTTQEVQKPYVTVRRTAQVPQIVKNDTSTTDQMLLNVAIFGETYKQCMDISNAIRAVLDGYSGTEATINYRKVWYQSSEDLIDEEDDAYVIIDKYSARTTI